MQNYTNNILMIKSELVTLEDYIEVAKKIIFQEDIGYEVDYQELKSELESSKERFQDIFELLEILDNDIRELERRIENE